MRLILYRLACRPRRRRRRPGHAAGAAARAGRRQRPDQCRDRRAGDARRRGRPPGRRGHRLRPALDRPVHAARARAACPPIRSRRPAIPPIPAGATPASRRWCRGYVEAAPGRPDDRRLLPPRRHRRPPLANQGFAVAGVRLAPRRAQMRRPRLFAPVGPAALSRHARRLCRRDRPQEQPPEARRDHGFGRQQPSLSDHRPQHGGDPALLARAATSWSMSATSAAGRASCSTTSPPASERLLIPGNHITFAPRFSPDGRDVVFSMANGGNTDIYIVSANGGAPRRLTSAPGADTSPSFSPDGRQIVFESDRSGTQQLYVMERRRLGPAADQLRRRPLCLAGLEPGRQPHRLHQDRRAVPHRRDERRRAAASAS